MVFEVWSPHNRWQDMEDKPGLLPEVAARRNTTSFYLEFPSHAEGWRREGEKLVRLANMNGHVSPRLGIRFVLDTGELTIVGVDGEAVPLTRGTHSGTKRCGICRC